MKTGAGAAAVVIVLLALALANISHYNYRCNYLLKSKTQTLWLGRFGEPGLLAIPGLAGHTEQACLALDKAATRYVKESDEEESRTVEMYDMVSLVNTRSSKLAMQVGAGADEEHSASEEEK